MDQFCQSCVDRLWETWEWWLWSGWGLCVWLMERWCIEKLVKWYTFRCKYTGDPKCMVPQGSLDLATQISSRIKCCMYLFYLWMGGGNRWEERKDGGSSQGRVMGTLWLSMGWSQTVWPLLAQLSIMCSWAGSVTSLGLGFLICKMSVTVVTTLWEVLCPRQIDSWGAPRYIRRTPCDILLLAVISVYDTWIATWGHAHSLKTSQMWFWFMQIVIYIFSPWRRPHHHPWADGKVWACVPLFLKKLIN